MNLKNRQLGKYELVERLGRGGMAEVFKGFQPSIERFVAIKVMHKHLAAEDQFIERFRSEAKGIAQLRHHNIVRIIDFDIEDDLYYMVLDYIEGQTLRTYLKKNGLLEPRQALYIIAQLADALAYAHGQGIIHRDIKPGNIIFMDDSVSSPVLTDFGLARILNDNSMTVTGTMIGTPAYMSPEALRGEKLDARGDIYSLGVVLYEMVVGRTPYTAESPYGMILKQLHDPLPAPRAVNPDLPEVMEQLILKAMAKDISERFQSAKELCLAIQEAFTILTNGETLPFTLTKTLPPRIRSPKYRSAKAKYSSKRRFMSLSGALGGSVMIAFLMVQLLVGGGDKKQKARNTSLLTKPTIESVVMAEPFIAESPSITAPIVPTAPKDSGIVAIEPSSGAIEAPQAVPPTPIPPQVRQVVPTVIPPGVHVPAGDHVSAPEQVPTRVVGDDYATEEREAPATTPTEVPLAMPTEVPQAPAPAPTEVPALPTEVPALPTEVPSQIAVAVLAGYDDYATEVPSAPPAAPATAIPTQVPQAPAATAIPTQAPAATAIPTQAPAATAIPTQVPQLPATAIPTQAPAATAIPTQAPSATAIPTQAPPATATQSVEPTQIPQPTEVIASPQPTEEPTRPTPSSEQIDPLDDNSDEEDVSDDHKGDNKGDKGDNKGNGGDNSGDDKGDGGQQELKDDKGDNKGSNNGDNSGSDAQDDKGDEDKKDDKEDEDKKDDKEDEDKKDDKEDEDKKDDKGDEDKKDDKGDEDKKDDKGDEDK